MSETARATAVPIWFVAVPVDLEIVSTGKDTFFLVGDGFIEVDYNVSKLIAGVRAQPVQFVFNTLSDLTEHGHTKSSTVRFYEFDNSGDEHKLVKHRLSIWLCTKHLNELVRNYKSMSSCRVYFYAFRQIAEPYNVQTVLQWLDIAQVRNLGVPGILRYTETHPQQVISMHDPRSGG